MPSKVDAMSKSRKVMFVFIRLIGSISEKLGNAVSFLILSLLIIIPYEVIARYLFNRPTQWASDLSTLIAGTLAIVAGLWATYLNIHINFDIFYKRMSFKQKAIIDLITSPLLFILCGILAWKGAQAGWLSFKIRETTATVWAPPLYPIKILIPVVAVLMLIQGIAHFIRNLYRVIKGKDISGAEL